MAGQGKANISMEFRIPMLVPGILENTWDFSRFLVCPLAVCGFEVGIIMINGSNLRESWIHSLKQENVTFRVQTKHLMVLDIFNS